MNRQIYISNMDNIIHKMDNILLYLAKNKEKKHTMNYLSKKLNIPYATFHRKINELEKIILIETIGNSKIITLNKKNEELYPRLILESVKQKEELMKKKPVLKILLKDYGTEIVLLFGSFAKGEDTKTSDIDVMVINKTGRKTLSFKKEEVLLGREINALFFTEEEFKEMLRSEEENVGKQAYKDNILLNNPKKFWEIVYDEL